MAKQKAESNALKKCHDHLPSLVRFQTRICGLKRWPESSRNCIIPAMWWQAYSQMILSLPTETYGHLLKQGKRDTQMFETQDSRCHWCQETWGYRPDLHVRMGANESKVVNGEWSPDQSLAYSVLTKATHTHPVVILLVPKWTNISWQLKKATTQHQLLGLWSRGGGVALTVGRKFGPFRSFNIC